ncbi:MAG: hypothetical protein KDH96_09655, partial [Candidatus Riesia sp.]|nr:hypothetical protein [Candidatus Riesia sp.]
MSSKEENKRTEQWQDIEIKQQLEEQRRQHELADKNRAQERELFNLRHQIDRQEADEKHQREVQKLKERRKSAACDFLRKEIEWYGDCLLHRIETEFLNVSNYFILAQKKVA